MYIFGTEWLEMVELPKQWLDNKHSFFYYFTVKIIHVYIQCQTGNSPTIAKTLISICWVNIYGNLKSEALMEAERAPNGIVHSAV